MTYKLGEPSRSSERARNDTEPGRKRESEKCGEVLEVTRRLRARGPRASRYVGHTNKAGSDRSEIRRLVVLRFALCVAALALLLALDALVDFFPMDGNVLRCVDSDTHLVAFHTDRKSVV